MVNLPVSPLSDRSKPGISTSQVEFLSMVAIPMFEVWTSAFPKAVPFVIQAPQNLKRWRLIRNEPLSTTASVNLPPLEPGMHPAFLKPERTASEDLRSRATLT